MISRALATVALTLVAASMDTQAGGSPPPFPQLAKSELKVVSGTGTHCFQVWIAADDESRRRGLMFVRELPADHGMLFLFERPRYATFWMKDTPLSLDIIFVAPDGRVVNISHRTKPLSEDPVGSDAAVTGVLELLAGTAVRIGLKPGDRLVHPHFAPQ
jgi:uncharacterized membrane protein (UPF0127 family)